MITIGKTLVVVAALNRKPFGQVLLEVDAGGRNANAVLHQLGGVAKDFSGQGDGDAAIQWSRIDAQLTGWKSGGIFRGRANFCRCRLL